MRVQEVFKKSGGGRGTGKTEVTSAKTETEKAARRVDLRLRKERKNKCSVLNALM